MNVIALKTMVYTFLKTLTDRVYDGIAQPNAAFPYVTYALRYTNTDENMVMERVTMEVDIWDNKPIDTTALETLTGLIDGDGKVTGASGLHRKHYYSASVLTADSYRINRLDIEDEDPVIRRRKLIYEILSYL